MYGDLSEGFLPLTGWAPPGRPDRHAGWSPVLRGAQLVGVPAEDVLDDGGGAEQLLLAAGSATYRRRRLLRRGRRRRGQPKGYLDWKAGRPWLAVRRFFLAQGPGRFAVGRRTPSNSASFSSSRTNGSVSGCSSRRPGAPY
ncbi:hypothetical protein [Streptomyces canus]|uniref:hypothetical protein n=1 Tax=Streptomyces canus TaxID=58343 RepID=UPI0027D8D71A|nr:hypothetical protein [Streptomyces canus]